MAELRSRARLPSRPMTSAARMEPVSEPSTTFAPNSRAPDAPANESSLMLCTANGMSRIITNTLISPPTTPSTAPARIELCTRANSWP